MRYIELFTKVEIRAGQISEFPLDFIVPNSKERNEALVVIKKDRLPERWIEADSIFVPLVLEENDLEEKAKELIQVNQFNYTTVEDIGKAEIILKTINRRNNKAFKLTDIVNKEGFQLSICEYSLVCPFRDEKYGLAILNERDILWFKYEGKT